MSKKAVFTMKLEPELRTEFMAAAEAAHRPASQVLRELMREFVQRQREAREYDEFLRRKVEAGRASMRAGLGQSNDEVEAEFAARRADVADREYGLFGRPRRSKTGRCQGRCRLDQAALGLRLPSFSVDLLGFR